ncbi:MAG: efflux RND transporter periplasmic adaptor subunit [Phycisphaeraceae bacterium]
MNPTTEQAGQSAPAVSSLPQHLQELASSEDLPSRVIEQALSQLVEQTDSLGALLWMSADSAGEQLKPVGRVGEAGAPLLDPHGAPRGAMMPALRQAWSLRKITAIGPGQSTFEDTPLHRTTQFLLPISGAERVIGLLHLIGPAEVDPKQYRALLEPAQQVGQALGLYLSRRQEKVQQQDQTSQRELLKLMRQMVRAEAPRAMLSELANFARSVLDAQQAAAVAWVGTRTEVLFSEAVEINRRAVRVRNAQSLAEAARQRKVPLTYTRDQPLHGEDEQLAPLLHQFFEMSEAAAVVLLPLTDGERVPGALIVEYLHPGDASERSPTQQMLAEDAGPVLARGIDEHRRPLRRTSRVLLKLREQPLRALATVTMTLALLAALVAGLFFVPVPLDVRVDATLEPRQAATVTAPYEGRIAEVLAAPGQHVQAGDVLMRFESRDWELELASIEAQLRQQRVAMNAALRESDMARFESAQLEVQRLTLQRQRVQRRLDDATVHADIAGVVLSERLDRLQGRNVAAGDELFELGNLDEFDLVLQVPERDLPLVERAMRESGEVPLTFLSRAFPEMLQRAAVTERARLLPTSVADERQDEPMYRMIVPLELPEGHAQLALANPSGRAKLAVGESSVAYRYFRRAWHYLRMQFLF